MNNGIKGIKIKRLCIVLIVVEAILVSIAIQCAITTANKYNTIDALTSQYISVQEDIYNIKQASDYLTAKARQYVMTGEPEYAMAYWQEISVDMHRERAVERVNSARETMGIADGTDYMSLALEESNDLAQIELHAMALEYSITYSGEGVPEAIKNYTFSKEELLMSQSERQEYARNLLFDKNYSSFKDKIDGDVSFASNQLLSDIKEKNEENSLKYHVASISLKIILILLAIIFIIIATVFLVFLIHGIGGFINRIKDEEKANYGISYELNYLVDSYNKLFEKNESIRKHLKKTAERDALTGLLNRNGYERVKEFYRKSKDHIAFILIDVDHFKEVNDTYGHEEGDRALVTISKILFDSFRDNDFIIRYGGDEFIVIMTGLASSQKRVIESKLGGINVNLRESSSDRPYSLSVSMGVAFSDNGYQDGLFEKADEALYHVKENGRGGYSFA